jgi:hypothetical protein
LRFAHVAITEFLLWKFSRLSMKDCDTHVMPLPIWRSTISGGMPLRGKLKRVSRILHGKKRVNFSPGHRDKMLQPQWKGFAALPCGVEWNKQLSAFAGDMDRRAGGVGRHNAQRGYAAGVRHEAMYIGRFKRIRSVLKVKIDRNISDLTHGVGAYPECSKVHNLIE